MTGLNATENSMLYLLGEGCVDVKHVYEPMQRFIDFSVLSFKRACFHAQTCEAPEGWPGYCRDPLPLLWVSRNGQPWKNASASGYRSEIEVWIQGLSPIFNETLKITSTLQWGQSQIEAVWASESGPKAQSWESWIWYRTHFNSLYGLSQFVWFFFHFPIIWDKIRIPFSNWLSPIYLIEHL